ncbi:MAG TPA: nuclear transport factor 2 family protein [Chthoniobacterales bacterium]|nr:nuclear transport factor 2 family protein [Chthoniobacterales bacterium]
MPKTIPFLLALTIAAAASTASPARTADLAKDEAQIWNLEQAYWEYVKTSDLEKYRALFRDDFVGWPLITTAPVRKDDHITDWITNNTSKGITLQSYSMEQLAVRVTGDVAINHYRIKLNWAKVDNGEAARTDALRITHTWIQTCNTWQILGGMSASVNSDGK